jgi:hypothetical protein
MSSAPALRPITSAQTVATTTAQHFDFSNPASSQQQPPHAAQHVLLHHLSASAQAESPRSPPSTPQTPQHAHISQHTATPSPTVLPPPTSPSSSSTSSPEPPAAGPSSLAGVWRDFSLAISRDPAAQRFRNSHTQPGRRHHSSAAIIHGLMIRSSSRQPAISRHSSRFSHMRSVAPAPL